MRAGVKQVTDMWASRTELSEIKIGQDAGDPRIEQLLAFNPRIRQPEPVTALMAADKSDEASLPAIEIPIFFCSDRKTISSNKSEDGKTLGPAQFGTATIRVPRDDRWFDEQNNLSRHLVELGWRSNNSEPTLKPYIELRGYVAEKNTAAVLKDVRTDKEFFKHLSDQVKHDKEHRVYIYIHGFASSGENALYSTGVLASQLEAPVVSFTWPSAGKIGSQLFGSNSPRALFRRDRKIIDSPEVMQDLDKLIHRLKTELPADTRINLIAHSLGNRLMNKYLDGDSNDKLDSVYFIAPDLAAKMFLSALPDISAKSKNIAVYMNRRDRVLGASSLNSLFELSSAKKLGKANVKAPGIDFIDYEQIAMPRGIGHYVPFEHLGSMIRTRMPFSDKSQENKYFLMRRTSIEKQK